MRCLLIFCLLFTTYTVNAQFILMPKGFVDLENSERSFVVQEFPGKSQQEIYDLVKTYFEKNSRAPFDILTVEEGSSVTITSTAPKAIPSRYIMSASRYDLYYQVVMEMRDGRMRFKAPQIYRMMYVNSDNVTFNLCLSSDDIPAGDGRQNSQGAVAYHAIFSGKGKVRDHTSKFALEDFFNAFVKKIQGVVLGIVPAEEPVSQPVSVPEPQVQQEDEW